jgi:hypothetical protein
VCPRGSGPNEDRRADAEDLAEPGRCKATPIRSKQNRAQGAAADSYRIDPDPICDGPAVADRNAAAESRLGVVTKKRRRSKHERATMKIEDKIDQTRGDRRVSHAVHRGEKNPRFWLYTMLRISLVFI